MMLNSANDPHHVQSHVSIMDDAEQSMCTSMYLMIMTPTMNSSWTFMVNIEERAGLRVTQHPTGALVYIRNRLHTADTKR